MHVPPVTPVADVCGDQSRELYAFQDDNVNDRIKDGKLNRVFEKHSNVPHIPIVVDNL